MTGTSKTKTFRIIPENNIGGQDIVTAKFVDIHEAARSLRSIFPSRHGSECVSIEMIDRDHQEIDDDSYGLFVLANGKRFASSG